MKKILALLLALSLTLGLAACSAKDPATPAASPSPAPTADILSDSFSLPEADVDNTDVSGPNDFDLPDNEGADVDVLPSEEDTDLSALIEPDDGASPTPTPAANAAAADVKFKDYVLADYTDDAMKVSLQYPSHWTVEPGTNTVSFTEPSSAAVPMRLALTVKDFTEEKLSVAASKKQFNAYMKVIKGGYDNFKVSGQSNKLVFMNRASLSAYYNAKLDGGKVKGFVIMCSVAKDKKIYALHFYAPQAKFKSFASIFKKILYSVKPVA